MSINLKISLCVLVVDLIASIGMVILGFMTRFNGKYIAKNMWYCGFTDLFYVNQVYMSIYYLGLMSLERGLLIMYRVKLPDLFWIVVIVGESFYFLILSSIAIGKGQISLLPLVYACMVTPDFKLGIVLTWSFFILLVFNFVCMLYCYIGIAVKLRSNAWKNIRELNLDKDTTLRQANRTIAKVLLLLVIYIASNGFEVLNFSLEIVTGITRPPINDCISTSLLCAGPIANGIILVQFHDPVKISLLESFPFLKMVIKHDPTTSLGHN